MLGQHLTQHGRFRLRKHHFTRSLGVMAKDERREHLLLVLDNLIQVWNGWSANSDVRYITKTFEDAVNDALLVFGDGSIPGDMRALYARMDVLQEQWAAWNRKNETSGGKYPIPNSAFWKALESIEAARQAIIKPVRRNLETIVELTAQKVVDAQICRIYGFTDNGMPDGNPEPWKLQEERQNPGTHTDRARGWLPPWEKKSKTDEAKQVEIIERIQRTRAGKLKLLAAVAPESIEQLIQEGVSGKQICKMKKIDEASLAAYCQDHGLDAPNWAGESPNAMVGVHDYVPEDEVASVLSATERPSKPPMPELVTEEPMTLEQEIIEYHKQGTMTPAEIAAAVSCEGNEVSHQKVGKVIARWEKEPQAFETTEVG
jgi:hypothetical protein